ncbi:MAG: ATP synthase subunit AtpR [Gammaproteobacteria bacterium]|nr:ATP synthase subunit AtpR [Gammaproteobacteria bacterium]
MIEIQGTAIVLGLAVGLPMAVLFFWGLNWGMRLALASSQPGGILMLSFFVRLVILLGVGLALTRLTDTLWALAGYMLAFLAVRVIAVVRARIKPTAATVQQENL